MKFSHHLGSQSARANGAQSVWGKSSEKPLRNVAVLPEKSADSQPSLLVPTVKSTSPTSRALTEKFWRNAIPNPFYRPVKKQLTVRLDADVIAWLRKQGKGYQTRMNGLLRAAMLAGSRPQTQTRQLVSKTNSPASIPT